MKYITRYRAKIEVHCEDCENPISFGLAYYMVTNRADETTKCCPDCAARRMAETLDGYNRTEYYDHTEY